MTREEVNYTLGSLFDGSGGFPLAGSLCGITPIWASEVEPYPIAVTRSRFPALQHLGDISKINGAEIPPVDIITFGSPCQDLSVAGKRAGLKHESNGDEETTRSGLFMEAVRIIKEMRGATNGRYPSFAVWENVPGAFSSNKGEDFRVVLEELIKIAEPAAAVPPMPKGGWPYADCYVGDGWSVAYRTFDAQYWGVPQRRRRIHLVADFGGERAGKILFEREGVRGYFTQGRTPWQGTAADAESGPGTADREGNCLICMATQQGGAEVRTDNKAPTLTAAAGMSGNNQPIVCIPINDKATRWQGGGASRNHDGAGNGLGVGADGDPSPTLTAGDRHAVAYAMQAFGQYAESQCFRRDGVCNTIVNGTNPGFQNGIVECAGVDCRNMNEYPELYPTLQAKPNGGQSLNFSGAVRIRYIVRRLTPTECARLQGFADRWGDIDQKEDFTEDEHRFWLIVRNTHAAINGKTVKEYTKSQMLTWYNKLHTDSSEYKMWGNGIALPPALYVMQGIENVLRNGTEGRTSHEHDDGRSD